MKYFSLIVILSFGIITANPLGLGHGDFARRAEGTAARTIPTQIRQPTISPRAIQNQRIISPQIVAHRPKQVA